jgi:hypothetical protein
LAYRSEKLVTRRVAFAVVHELQPVDVDCKDRERLAPGPVLQ